MEGDAEREEHAHERGQHCREGKRRSPCAAREEHGEEHGARAGREGGRTFMPLKMSSMRSSMQAAWPSTSAASSAM